MEQALVINFLEQAHPKVDNLLNPLASGYAVHEFPGIAVKGIELLNFDGTFQIHREMGKRKKERIENRTQKIYCSNLWNFSFFIKFLLL